MRATLCVSGLSLLAAVILSIVRADGGRASAAAKPRVPVVLELFTSEGCSSCPPADALLARLAADQPVDGAEVIPLELHVDYWNDLGWADPFSSPAYSERQAAYAHARRSGQVYTPQLVVAGARELVGSDARRAAAAVHAAAAAAAAPVAIALRLATDPSTHAVTATVELGARADDLDVVLAVTEDGLATDVPRGENAGAHLAHAPVVRSLTRLGRAAAGDQTATLRATVPVDPSFRRSHLRVVVFAQRPGPGAIEGATWSRLP